MKKLVLTTFGLAAIGMASYAARYMQVKTADGKIVNFDVEEVTEVNFTENEVTPVSNHEYVDLGLPSGTLWATYNIGATKPEELGDYFAWGETAPKEVYDWSTYKYVKAHWIEEGSVWRVDSLTKYNSNSFRPAVIDNLTTLLPEDDAATANWGSDWCMPTNEEQRELINYCQYEWTEVNGVTGGKFTASNGNSIFLPGAGYKNGDSGHGYYWSSSVYEDFGDDKMAPYCSSSNLAFHGSGAFYTQNNPRSCGLSVRAVRAKK